MTGETPDGELPIIQPGRTCEFLQASKARGL